MYEKHKTANGRKMMICQMDDNHLRNTILLFLKNVEEAKTLLTGTVQENKFRSALYGQDENLEKKAKGMIHSLTEKLYPYLAEAMLRGISFTERMQAVYERKLAEPQSVLFMPDQNLLPAYEYEEYDDEL